MSPIVSTRLVSGATLTLGSVRKLSEADQNYRERERTRKREKRTRKRKKSTRKRRQIQGGDQTIADNSHDASPRHQESTGSSPKLGLPPVIISTDRND